MSFSRTNLFSTGEAKPRRSEPERVTPLNGSLRGSVTAATFRGRTTTPVFDSYWRFASERHRVYVRRHGGQCPPWTDDPIIRVHKFTNVFRAADRVSQYLLRNVIYDEARPEARDIVLRVLLFKVFNRVDTWERLIAAFGEPSCANFNSSAYAATLDKALAAGGRVYSAAYITPPLPGTAGARKHAGHLELLAAKLRSGDIDRLCDSSSLRSIYEALLTWPGIGPFLAYQFTIDLNYTPVFDFSEDEFVVAGPGARDGLAKCFSGPRASDSEAIIRAVWAAQEEECAARGLEAPKLWGRRMSLIDVQNVFCEVSKYARIAHPGVRGTTDRHRIKQMFSSVAPLPPPFFPPKWGVVTEPTTSAVTLREEVR